jgi:hypothetical protein
MLIEPNTIQQTKLQFGHFCRRKIFEGYGYFGYSRNSLQKHFFVIYEQTVHGLSDSAFEPNRSLLETTVITHEFGHILGLTNLGTALQSNHEDAEHPKHCIEKTCLMFWSAEIGGGIGNMVSSGSAPQLDAQCIADLRANGGK